ncbi:MAG: HDIG domain-containing protein [Anaeromyxobacter sp.]
MPPTPESPRPAEAGRRSRREWTRQLLALALVACVGGAAGWLLSPTSLVRLPGHDKLGTPAPATVRADRDYDIEDQEATARRRSEAAGAVRPVYDRDVGAGDEAAARVRAAFQVMREEESALLAATPTPAPGELARRWSAQRGAFVSRLQVVVRDEDLAALSAARFSEQVEREIVALAQRGLAGMVVEDLQLLAADRQQGLAVRSAVGGELQGERVDSDLALVRDVASARAEVAQTGAARLASEKPALRAAAVRIASAMVRPTLVQAQAETDRRRAEARAAVKPVVLAVKRGERVLSEGEVIEERHLVILDGMRAQGAGQDLTHVRLGGGALVALVVALLWVFARRNLPRFKPGRRDSTFLASSLIGTLGLAAAGLAVVGELHERLPGLPPNALQYLLPVAAGALLVRQVLSAEVALLFALAAGLASGLLAPQSPGYAVYATLTSIAAAGLPSGGQDRARHFRTGAGVGLVGAGVVAALGLNAGLSPSDVAANALSAFLGGLLVVPLAVVCFLPLVEGIFGYVTDQGLLELANLNHPALKELIIQAPGTYHHAIVMGALVEAGAQAIGANPLLARVCAYYHDIGKTRNPLAFEENQRGDTRQDPQAPSMGALVVKRHVTDGLELARRWKLPRPVRDAIAEHHGTRRTGIFWEQARRAVEDGSARGPLDESLFRYPGPRPQSRESALVMIADACEASSRALDTPTGEPLRQLVEARIDEIFADGQLDDCELTLRDLTAVAAAMVRALDAIHRAGPGAPGRPPEPAGAPPVRLLARSS